MYYLINLQLYPTQCCIQSISKKKSGKNPTDDDDVSNWIWNARPRTSALERSILVPGNFPGRQDARSSTVATLVSVASAGKPNLWLQCCADPAAGHADLCVGLCAHRRIPHGRRVVFHTLFRRRLYRSFRRTQGSRRALFPASCSSGQSSAKHRTVEVPQRPNADTFRYGVSGRHICKDLRGCDHG